MADQQPIGNSRPEPDKNKPAEISPTTPAAMLPPDTEQAPPPTAEPVTLKKLTAEEQMALYEKELKEDDWGHQPC